MHGNGALAPEIPGGVVRDLVAQSRQQEAEAAVEFEAQAASSLLHNLFKQGFLFQRSGDTPDHIQIFIGNGAAVGQMELL